MSRTIFQIFENYQQARTTFVQTVAELAHRPQNVEALQNAGVMQLLRPLLLDTVPTIQQVAALALGRLANFSEALAEQVVANDILPQLVYSLSEKNRYYKKTAAFVLKSVAKHTPELAQAVVDNQALEALVGCLTDFDPTVREAAAWALGYVARHTPELAQDVVNAGAVPQLVLCLQEPELPLKRIAASTLSEITKHTPELAQVVVDNDAVTYLAPLIQHNDAKLKRHVCGCLSQIAKHNVDLAEVVVEKEVIPKIFNCLKDPDAIVRKHTATCIREIVKHTPELAQAVVNGGGHKALIDYMMEKDCKGANRLPAVMALGYIAAFSENLATAVMADKGIAPLKETLVNEAEDHLKAAAAWSLGQVGRHSSELAKALASVDVFRHLLAVYKDNKSSADLKKKAQTALKMVTQKCTYLPALEPLLHDAQDKILRYVVHQFAKVLPNNPSARKSFVRSKGLQRIQELKVDDKSKLQEYIATINACYPLDIIQYYSPGYSEQLIKKLDEADVAR